MGVLVKPCIKLSIRTSFNLNLCEIGSDFSRNKSIIGRLMELPQIIKIVWIISLTIRNKYKPKALKKKQNRKL